MAVRTTVAAVKAILVTDVNYDGESSLLPFIETANAIVDRVVTCATNKGKALTTAEAELVERWLSAHCYAMMDPLYQSKSTSGASASFQGQSGMYLDQTRYGQTAQNVDYSGCLAAISKRQVATASWLGKVPSSQTDVWDRD